MKKNQLSTTKSTALILGKSKSLMGITKKLLESKSKGLRKAKASQELTTLEGITIIGELMWEKETQEMTWYEATEYAKNLRLGGYDDWRLPTSEELLGVVILCGGVVLALGDGDWEEIINKNKANEIYQTKYKVKGFESDYYWSSITNVDFKHDAWYVGFHYGNGDWDSKFNSSYARCVRGGQ